MYTDEQRCTYWEPSLKPLPILHSGHQRTGKDSRIQPVNVLLSRGSLVRASTAHSFLTVPEQQENLNGHESNRLSLAIGEFRACSG
jgi:hypothetical protein